MAKDKDADFKNLNINKASAVVKSLAGKKKPAEPPAISKVAKERETKKAKPKKQVQDVSDSTSALNFDFLSNFHLPIETSLLDTLHKIAKFIMKNRTVKKQRITKNSVIRACLKVFTPMLDNNIDKLKDVETEEQLVRRVTDIVVQYSSVLNAEHPEMDEKSNHEKETK